MHTTQVAGHPHVPVFQEKQEEILGPNALLNRRIIANVQTAAKELRVAPCCPTYSPDGTTSEPRFHLREFVAHPLKVPTTARSTEEGPFLTAQVPAGEDVAASVFEWNAMFLAKESRYEAELEEAGTDGLDSRNEAHDAAKKALIRGAISTAIAQSGGTDLLGIASDGDTSTGAAGRTLPSLGELVKELAAEAVEDETKRSQAGTRFTHATEFAHEKESGVVAVPGGGSAEQASVAAPSAAGGAVDAKSAEEAAREKAQAEKSAAEAEQKAREEELAQLTEQLDLKEKQVADRERQAKLKEAETRQVSAKLTALSTEVEKLEKEAVVKEKTLSMLPDAEQHIVQLQQIIEGSRKKLIQLGEEWEKHRKPLLEQIRDLQHARTKRKERCRSMIDEMKKARSQMQEMAGDVREKEERARALDDEVGRMPKSVNRTLYTYRIMDIINSIAKQKKEIDKIIGEVNQVQKDINSVGERLSRAEALADEKIYSSAARQSKDAAMVQSYRFLQELRSNFDALISAIAEIGRKETEARDLESKTEQLLERVSKNNMERILADLVQVQAENQELISKIKQLHVAGK